MTSLFAVVLAVSSVAALFAGTRFLRLERRRLPIAWNQFLECLGVAVVFSALNVGLVALFVILSRTFGVGFLTAYVAGDPVWVMLSVGQAILFQLWRVSQRTF